MGEATFLSCRVPGTTRWRVVEAHCGDPQLEGDTLELGFRVANWFDPDAVWGDTVWHWRRGRQDLGLARETSWCYEEDHDECDGRDGCECRCHVP